MDSQFNKDMVTTTTFEKGENTTLKSINNYSIANKEKVL